MSKAELGWYTLWRMGRWNKKKKEALEREELAVGGKHCSRCCPPGSGVVKPFSDFGKYAEGRHGLCQYCKACRKEMQEHLKKLAK